MWKLLRKRLRPSARDLLLRIIPKVELVPVVVPEKFEIPKGWKPPESKTLTMAAKKASAAKKKKSGKASPEAKAMTDKYSSDINALDQEKASNIIKNA